MPSGVAISHPSNSLQMQVPFACLNLSIIISLILLDLWRSSGSPMCSWPNISPKTISAPVHAPHTFPLRIPLPKQDPSLNAVSSLIPHSSAYAASTACEQCIPSENSCTALSFLLIIRSHTIIYSSFVSSTVLKPTFSYILTA